INPAQPADFQRIIEEAFDAQPATKLGVLHLWSLNSTMREPLTLAALEEAQGLGCISALHLALALARANERGQARMWLITSQAQAVGNEAHRVSFAQAPLWGLGRVIHFEHPELHCKLIDLDAIHQEQCISSLLDELQFEDSENQIAWRNGTRFVARLVRGSG